MFDMHGWLLPCLLHHVDKAPLSALSPLDLPDHFGVRRPRHEHPWVLGDVVRDGKEALAWRALRLDRPIRYIYMLLTGFAWRISQEIDLHHLILFTQIWRPRLEKLLASCRWAKCPGTASAGKVSAPAYPGCRSARPSACPMPDKASRKHSPKLITWTAFW